MPFLNIKSNVPISPAAENAIKTKLGKAIEIIPGKHESGLMILFQDGCRLYYQGEKDRPIVMMEVSLYLESAQEDCANFTQAAGEIIAEALSIPADSVCCNFAELHHWIRAKA